MVPSCTFSFLNSNVTQMLKCNLCKNLTLESGSFTFRNNAVYPSQTMYRRHIVNGHPITTEVTILRKVTIRTDGDEISCILFTSGSNRE